MGMGIGIVLLVIGAILGYICMGAGALALVLGLVTNAQATRTKHTSVIERRDDQV